MGMPTIRYSKPGRFWQKFVCMHLKIFYLEEQLNVKIRTEKSMELYEIMLKRGYPKVLSDEEFLTELDKKLDEEIAEYQADKSLERI